MRGGQLSTADDGQSTVAGAVVQPFGPAYGGSAGRPDILSPFRGTGTPGRDPDHSTISRFRTELSRRGLSEELFAELECQLDNRGMMVKEGTLMDATLVEAQVRRPPSPRAVEPRVLQTPTPTGAILAAGRGPTSATRFTWGLGGVRGGAKAVLTPAKVYESLVADELVSGDEGAVYGDRAYESRRRRPVAEVSGDKGPDHAPFPQASAGPPLLAERAQRANKAEGGRWWRRCSVPSSASTGTAASATGGLERNGVEIVVQADGLQHAEGGQAVWMPGLNPGDRALCRGTPRPQRRKARSTGPSEALCRDRAEGKPQFHAGKPPAECAK